MFPNNGEITFYEVPLFLILLLCLCECSDLSLTLLCSDPLCTSSSSSSNNCSSQGTHGWMAEEEEEEEDQANKQHIMLSQKNDGEKKSPSAPARERCFFVVAPSPVRPSVLIRDNTTYCICCKDEKGGRRGRRRGVIAPTRPSVRQSPVQ